MTGELDPETVASFEDHLRLCPDCVAFLNTYKKTVQATRSLRFEDIPAEMEKRVRRFLRERTQKGHLGR
jgi:anti-sigma factor RsiW